MISETPRVFCPQCGKMVSADCVSYQLPQDVHAVAGMPGVYTTNAIYRCKYTCGECGADVIAGNGLSEVSVTTTSSGATTR